MLVVLPGAAAFPRHSDFKPAVRAGVHLIQLEIVASRHGVHSLPRFGRTAELGRSKSRK
jgi:hypothetical protein